MEASDQLAAAAQAKRARSGIALRLLLAAATISLVMDPHFNFSALKPVLLAEGLYAGACGPSSSASSSSASSSGAEAVGALCDEQLRMINNLFIVFTGAVNMMGALYGVLVDKLRRRTCLYISAALLSSWLWFGLVALRGVPLWVQTWALPLLFVLAGVGGSLSFAVGLTYMNDVDLTYPEGHVVFNPGFASCFLQACVNLCGGTYHHHRKQRWGAASASPTWLSGGMAHPAHLQRDACSSLRSFWRLLRCVPRRTRPLHCVVEPPQMPPGFSKEFPSSEPATSEPEPSTPAS
eukprot:TRINITY_DN2910_c0_g1_i1.p1 TRINITY_DN2910_c0_g1~~TRINITY_DN2910_c0_g1_i1.p1  ORF type:complete len:300 (-),score=50.03 TRINITY_DN2910_c0_g1_i1:666-1544(-)